MEVSNGFVQVARLNITSKMLAETNRRTGGLDCMLFDLAQAGLEENQYTIIIIAEMLLLSFMYIKPSFRKKLMNLGNIGSGRSLFYIWLLLTTTTLLDSGCNSNLKPEAIDRYALVNRHLPVCEGIDPLSPFTVGNGEYAFTVDVTGLQTVWEPYESGIPLVTQSQWGWHRIPDSAGFQIDETFEYFDTYGRPVPYASNTRTAASDYLRANPHRLHLGRIGFRRGDTGHHQFRASDITDVHQVMDIWEGVVKSAFTLDSCPMKVETCVHPQVDQIAVRIESPELGETSLAIGFDFPYGSLQWGKNAADWESPFLHTTHIESSGEDFVILRRELDSTVYYVDIRWGGAARFTSTGEHHYLLEIDEKESFSFTCRMSAEPGQSAVDTQTTFNEARQYWKEFWLSGGVVDLSQSPHPQALELERRIVLSRYLTAIQCSGSLPPQETGLTVNSWFGKYHLEMHWWHAVHFVLWGHPELLENSMDWYGSILPRAREKAQLQGYEGVRWPKMTSPEGYDSPSGVGEFLIWQQPHPIYYAELLYRNNPDREILERYREIVFETAEFMASYAAWDDRQSRYILGPPLIPAQEIYRPHDTYNPAFELSYWKYGLQTAQLWQQRLGLERIEKWDHVIDHLAELPSENGLYQNTGNALNTFSDPFHRNDHPTLLGAYGMIPNEGIDVDMMQRTLEQVMDSWNWERTWGWDYPLTAMTAARVGRPDLAIEALLMDVEKNTYLNNGHNYQSDRLPLYLPGNGGLLTAVAMMAAGWEGAPDTLAPGFPLDGNWVVRFEGLKPLP